jgi:hypothetical protein
MRMKLNVKRADHGISGSSLKGVNLWEYHAFGQLENFARICSASLHEESSPHSDVY